MYTDWFVGGVAVLIGLLALVHGIAPREQTFTMPKLRWLEQAYGRTTARVFLGVLGATLILLGIAIALGWKLEWPEERNSREMRFSGNSAARRFAASPDAPGW